MKRILLIYAVSLLCAGFLMTACEYDTAIPNPEQYQKIYMPQALESPAERTFVRSNEPQSMVFGAAYGGPTTLGTNVEVKFHVNVDLVDEFNTENGTSYAILPEGSFELAGTSVTIEKGEESSAPLSIEVSTMELEPFKQYLLPVSIDNVSEKFVVNEDLRTTYFLVEVIREGTNIKVMSLGKGSGKNDMNAVAAIVMKENPDLLLVREIDRNTDRSGPSDHPAILAELIGMPHYVFANALNFQNGEYGAVVYSKFPIVESSTHMLPTSVSEKGPLAIITVQVNETQRVVFAGTHLNANTERRSTQTPALVDIMAEYTDPVILAGNFNDRPPDGTTYELLAEQFSFPCTTCPFNYPASGPTGYSDFIIFKSPNEFRVLNHTVGRTSTSAHLPVITEFSLYK